MAKNTFLPGLLLLTTSVSLQASEIEIALAAGKPTQQEFEVATKRALFSRNYDIWSVDQGVIVGMYQGEVEMTVILADGIVVIRNTDSGGRSSETIGKYLRNLQRDLTYELAGFALAPQSKGDPAKAKALIASLDSGDTSSTSSETTTVITGKYQSQITSSSKWMFNKPSEQSPDITFTQQGNEVTGINEEFNLKISGTIEGDEIHFFTWPSDFTTYEIKGTWEISREGRRLTGKWRNPLGNGDWNLTRIE